MQSLMLLLFWSSICTPYLYDTPIDLGKCNNNWKVIKLHTQHTMCGSQCVHDGDLDLLLALFAFSILCRVQWACSTCTCDCEWQDRPLTSWIAPGHFSSFSRQTVNKFTAIVTLNYAWQSYDRKYPFLQCIGYICSWFLNYEILSWYS